MDSSRLPFSVKFDWAELRDMLFRSPTSIDFQTYYFLRGSGRQNLFAGSEKVGDDKSRQLLLLSELKVLSRSELLDRLLLRLIGEKFWVPKFGGVRSFFGAGLFSEMNIDWLTLPLSLGTGMLTALN